MQREVSKQVRLPDGISLTWSGQYEYLERATAKLKIVLPFTLMIIFILLYVTFGRVKDALLIMGTLPFSLIGSGCWAITCRWPPPLALLRLPAWPRSSG